EKVHLTSCLLSRRLSDRLAKIPGVTLYAGMPDAGILPSGANLPNADLSLRTAIVAFNVGSLDPREVTAILDGSFDIQCRGGIHCAPLTHEVLETSQRGGCVRMSPGIFNTIEQMDLVADAVEQIASECRE
ncbi:MAG: aminotransferase class V-fold PLP-dependent enzyme, partial [Planctomyces sp.]